MADKSFGYFIKELWALWKERQLTRRALRNLAKQEWSVEFLTALLVRAASITKHSLEMRIVGPNGTSFIINTVDNTRIVKDDDIFNHLDDDVKIKQFMETLKYSG